MKTRNKLYLSLIIAACTLNAYATSQIGNIDDFDGTLKDYTLKRADKTIEIGVYEPLYSNDRIYVSRQCGEI